MCVFYTFSPGVTDILHMQLLYAAYPFGNPGEEKFPVLSWRLSPHPVNKPERSHIETNTQMPDLETGLSEWKTVAVLQMSRLL